MDLIFIWDRQGGMYISLYIYSNADRAKGKIGYMRNMLNFYIRSSSSNPFHCVRLLFESGPTYSAVQSWPADQTGVDGPSVKPRSAEPSPSLSRQRCCNSSNAETFFRKSESSNISKQPSPIR